VILNGTVTNEPGHVPLRTQMSITRQCSSKSGVPKPGAFDEDLYGSAHTI